MGAFFVLLSVVVPSLIGAVVAAAIIVVARSVIVIGPAQVVVKPGLGSADRMLARMRGSLTVTFAGPLARGPKTSRAPGKTRVPLDPTGPRAVLPRASRILQAIVVEAEARGYTVEIPEGHVGRNSGGIEWSCEADGHIAVTCAGHASRLSGTVSLSRSEAPAGRPPILAAVFPAHAPRR